MPYVTSWTTPDCRTLLNLEEAVVQVFRQHAQVRSSDPEAGGILLGTVHGLSMIINEATIPSAWDTRLRYFFDRLPFGHGSIASARWKDSDGIIRYLGEWHTHPEDIPHPSGIDRSEWKRVSKRRLDGRPLLAIIVGRKELHVELVTANGGSTLYPLEQI